MMITKIAVTPPLQSHTTLPPLICISATKIPLPEDTMEDDSNHLGAMERELGLQCQSFNNIHDQLIVLIVLSGGVNPGVEALPVVTNAVVSSLQLLVSSQEAT